MPSYRAAWLIGSYADMPEQEVTIEGVHVVVPAGNYYLYDPTDLLSLCNAMREAMFDGGVAPPLSAQVRRNGRVELVADANFTVNWGTGTLLRDLLGFDASLSGASSYLAPNISPLLWMPGKPETPTAQRLGLTGQPVHAVYQAVAPYSGKTESVSHGSRSYARYSFPMIDTERVITAGNEGGTYGRWFEQIAVRSARWKLYRDVIEDWDSDSPTNPVDPLGPYIVSGGDQGKGPRWNYDTSKGFERVDARADIDIRCHVVEDYPT